MRGAGKPQARDACILGAQTGVLGSRLIADLCAMTCRISFGTACVGIPKRSMASPCSAARSSERGPNQT